MKKQLQILSRSHLYSMILLFMLVTSSLDIAAQIHLVKDFETSPQGGATRDEASVVSGQNYFFMGSTNITGNELWKTNGTAQGTAMVKELTPGPLGSGINRNILTLNGSTIFTLRNQIWKTDGTENGTVLVKSFPAGSYFPALKRTSVIFNGRAFFVVYVASKSQLWATNGDPNGTEMIKEFGGGISEIAVSGGMLYISGADANVVGGLWKSDGTTANTEFIPSDMRGNPTELTDVNGTLFFSAYTATAGTELWKSNGTTATTSMVMDIHSGGLFSYPRNLISTNGKLYFVADDGINGLEVWVNNGTTTTLLKDVYPGDESGSLAEPRMLGVNGQLYFVANDNAHGFELWKSDGTAQGTSLLMDIAPGGESSAPASLTFLNGHIYFSAFNAQFGRELWRTDGTPVGTLIVKDGVEGAGESNPHDLMAAGNKLYFFAWDEVHGDELWISGGNAGNTMLLKEIAGGTQSTYVEEIIEVSSTSYFTDNSSIIKTDGTEMGTTTIEPSQPSISYYELTKATSGFYYVAYNASTRKYKLYKSAGTAGSSVAISPDLDKIYRLKVVNGILYFVGDDGIHGEELWRTNGALSETSMVKDINPGNASSSPSEFQEYEGNLFFTATNGANGRELWKCAGGTELGTTMVSDINPGLNGSATGMGLTEYKGILYFQAETQPAGRELWRSDGTPAGTWMVLDAFGASGQALPVNLVILNETLYFVGHDGVSGFALYKTDGTGAGTSIVFNPEETFISNLALVNGTLYLDLGTSLWTSDGTAEGTKKLIDLPSRTENFFEHNGHLFLVMNNELWKSDGDVCNTFAVNNKSEVAVDPYTIPKGVGDKLYFTGISEAAGAELFYYDFSTINTPGCLQSVSIADIPQKKFGEQNFNLEANASSGMPLVFTSNNSAVATVSGNVVTIVGAGEVTFTATQEGDNRYAVASADKTIAIGKALATLSLSNISNVYTGSALTATATTSPAALNGVQFVYTQNGNAVESINAGTYAVEVSLNNANYEAEVISGTFTILKAHQSITFETLEEKIMGSDPFDPGASASSQLPVTYSSSNETVATVTDGKIRVVGAGTTVIKATQTGNGNYETAAEVTQNLTVVKKTQTISFPALASVTVGSAPIELSATASSTLSVTYRSSNLQVATINNNKVVIVGAGVATITAMQEGNNEFASVALSRELVVNKKSQTITFAPLAEKIREDAPFTINATSSSNLPVGFSSSNTSVATVTGNTVTIVGAGETVITASNAGDAEFNAAASVTQTLVVKLITAVEYNLENETVVYPNPANDYTVVQGKYLNPNTVISLTDAKGKPVNELVTIGGFSEGSFSVDLSNLKSGVYLVKIKSGSQVAVKRIVKQ